MKKSDLGRKGEGEKMFVTAYGRIFFGKKQSFIRPSLISLHELPNLLDFNLRNNVGRSIWNKSWTTVFGEIVHNIWAWRNDFIHDSRIMLPYNPIFHIKQKLLFIQDSPNFIDHSNSCLVMTGWERPSSRWVKFNVDGARSERLGLAGIGGILRDLFGNWLGGFLGNIGRTSILGAELWAIGYALDLAWGKHITSLLVESDSLEAVNAISDATLENPHFNTITKIRDLLQRRWEASVHHILREGNQVADLLASKGLEDGGGILVLDHPPSNIIELMEEDKCGKQWPRLLTNCSM